MTDDTDDFLFAQHVGLNSPDFIFAFWGSVAWVPLISFYFSGVQPHLGAPQGDILYYIILYCIMLYYIVLYYIIEVETSAATCEKVAKSLGLLKQ